MSDPKPSPNDILSKIRAQKAAAAAAAAGSEPTAEPKAEVAAAPAAAPAAPPAPAAAQAPSAPRSPADIMASIRSAGKPAAAAAATPAAAKPAAAKPVAAGSAASIMDSIRSAGKPAAAAGAPAAAPAASAAPAPAAVVPAGLSPAEMIKAARSAESGAPVAPKVVLPTKPLPGKAAPTATKAAAEVSRRSVVGSVVATLCSPLVVAWGSFSAAAAASGLALARFMMPNVLVEPPTKFKIGPPTDYAPGTVSTKWQAQFNIWVVNSDVDGVRSIYALSTVCTHL
ncbi:MAG: hypothetical protein ACK57O_02975, partial [Planctomyces sp.]